MVNSVNATSSYGVQSTDSVETKELSEEEKRQKAQEEDDLFNFEEKSTATYNAPITQDTAKSTAKSYIENLKAQYPQLASKLDSYYSNLDFTTLCAEAATTSDVKAYIYNETQSLLN